ncbi:GAF domain-containing protein [Singulisphaera sp. GP187]|uniref:hybrid sensor histidine kinase/response regulator n=1 Tax=Singulisphaera sp. GP187 TaxID=1882752 RepID=UPI00092BA4E3|nr:response regulator [Singulisphaera sp. GP187]SIN77987.1 GAF domain-containing protein [Singulisphaera sp. GP187]
MQAEEKVKILLVDDQPNNLFALEAILEGSDRTLVRAVSGEDALMRVLDHDFAAILMDVQMPGMDGFETAALIRERDRSKHTPILFLTAFESSELQVFKGYSLGAVDYLSKPVVPAVLRSKVSVFVELFQKTEQVRRQSELLVENQRKEHERELVEEKRRWELDRLREETAQEKKVAEALRRRTEELAQTIAERACAEEQLRRRAHQQAIVAQFGQRALEGIGLPALLDEAVDAVRRNLEVEFARITELSPQGDFVSMKAGAGWVEDLADTVPVGVGTRSFSGFSLLSADPLVVDDLGQETRFEVPPFLRRHGVVSAISVKIHGRGRSFGTLEAFSRDRRPFTPDDAHFLQALAHVLATAIQRKRDEQELSRIKDELAVQLADMTQLHALSARLSNSLELPAVLEQVLAAVTSLQGTDRGVLMLYDRDLDLMSTAASVGFSEGPLDVVERVTTSLQESGTVSAIISGGIIVEDLEADPVFAPHLAAALNAGCRAVSSTPLLTVGGELVGTIATYFDRPHRPSDRETRLVELYGRQAAEFIEYARHYRQIREADRRKDEFLAMLAHELRNPLAPILNAIHYMRGETVDLVSVEQAREIAERQVRHLARLVDDLLDVSRISSGKIQLRKESIELADAVNRAVETSRLLIELRGHNLTVTLPEESLPLEADAARIEQVMANLLNNAAKYTEEGGRIALVVENRGKILEIRVRDTGIGIAPELLPRVFDLFTQDKRSLDRSQGGLGIGLTLVRNLVEMHGGSVVVRSEGVGKGSEFIVRLPRRHGVTPASVPLPDVPVPRQPDDASEAPPKRILVVDDNIDGALMLARLLRGWGHQLAVAHDGETAIELSREQAFDVVLLDIGLPGMNGYEIAQALRSQAGFEQTLLVALTGYGQGEDRRRSSEAGFDHHLVKPVDPLALKALLDRYQPLVRQESEHV